MMHSIITNGAGATSPETTRVIITGASLVHRRLNKRQRAVIGANILDGSVWFQPSQKQLAALLDVSSTYLNIARSLTSEERTAILNGFDSASFSAAPVSKRQLLPLPGFKTINGNGADADHALIQLAREVGPERMLAAAVAAEQHA
jgi:hypothetical protein